MLERFHSPLAKVAELLEGAEDDLLAFYRFPAAHWSKLRSTNSPERLNEIGRRNDVVGIFPNDASAIRLVGAMLIEQNDEWLVCRHTSPRNRSPWCSRTRATKEGRWSENYKPREGTDEELHHFGRLDSSTACSLVE